MVENKVIIIYKVLEQAWKWSFYCEEPSEEITTKHLIMAIKRLTWSEIWLLIKIKLNLWTTEK